MSAAAAPSVRARRVLPGFRLTLGTTVLYLSVIVLIPIIALVLKGAGIEARPVWTLMPDLPHLAHCTVIGDLSQARRIEDTLVNLPSSPWLLDRV